MRLSLSKMTFPLGMRPWPAPLRCITGSLERDGGEKWKVSFICTTAPSEALLPKFSHPCLPPLPLTAWSPTLCKYQEHLGDSCVCNCSQLWISWLRVVPWRQNITIGAFGRLSLPAVFAPLLPPAPFVSHYFNYPTEGRLIFNSRWCQNAPTSGFISP